MTNNIIIEAPIIYTPCNPSLVNSNMSPSFPRIPARPKPPMPPILPNPPIPPIASLIAVTLIMKICHL